MKNIFISLLFLQFIFPENNYPIFLLHGFMGWGNDELNNYIRDNEMGVRNDDDDVVMGYRKAIFDMISMKPKDGKEKETGDRLKQMDAPDDYEDSMDDLMKQMGDDEEISGMGAAEKANKKWK